MAWVATDNFESYDDGDNLDTLSGGSGWTANWDESTAGKYTISNAEAQSGTLSLEHDSFSVNGQEPTVSRTFTAVTSGEEGQFYIKKTASHVADNCSVGFFKGSTNAFLISISHTSGDIIILHDGGTDTVVSGSTLDQWYKWNIKFSGTTFTYSVDDAAFSTAKTYRNSITTGVDKMEMAISAANNADYRFYVDDISAPAASGPANMKSWNGLAIASIKSIKGLAIASVTKVNGLA